MMSLQQNPLVCVVSSLAGVSLCCLIFGRGVSVSSYLWQGCVCVVLSLAGVCLCRLIFGRGVSVLSYLGRGVSSTVMGLMHVLPWTLPLGRMARARNFCLCPGICRAQNMLSVHSKGNFETLYDYAAIVFKYINTAWLNNMHRTQKSREWDSLCSSGTETGSQEELGKTGC